MYKRLKSVSKDFNKVVTNAIRYLNDVDKVGGIGHVDYQLRRLH